MISFSHSQKSVPLPIEFINKYMITANATYVKVYLYGLAKCYENNVDELTNASIAEALDILETDVNKAWSYWKRVGLIYSEGKGNLVFAPIPSKEETVKEEPQKASSEKAVVEKSGDKQLVNNTTNVTMKEISQALITNPKMKETISMAEQLLKRTLSRREISAIYNFMDWYQMSQEMVLVLLEYCVNMEKTSFAYIEKVAKSWNEEGINSLDAATKILNRAAKENKMMNKCKRIFGIDRAFTTSEANSIATWVTELGMSENMIKAAYERTVNNTGKLSVPYMNSILRAWHQKGIKTVSQIAEKEGSRQNTKKAGGGYELDDMAAIERKLRLAKQNGQ